MRIKPKLNFHIIKPLTLGSGDFRESATPDICCSQTKEIMVTHVPQRVLAELELEPKYSL